MPYPGSVRSLSLLSTVHAGLTMSSLPEVSEQQECILQVLLSEEVQTAPFQQMRTKLSGRAHHIVAAGGL